MARERAILQRPITLAATRSQLSEDALRVGDNVAGTVFLSVYAITSGTNTLTIQTCADIEDSTGASSWITLQTITWTAVGAKQVSITNLGDAIRWNLTSPLTATTFGIVVFFQDVV